jgi:hypothetical protein
MLQDNGIKCSPRQTAVAVALVRVLNTEGLPDLPTSSHVTRPLHLLTRRGPVGYVRRLLDAPGRQAYKDFTMSIDTEGVQCAWPAHACHLTDADHGTRYTTGNLPTLSIDELSQILVAIINSPNISAERGSSIEALASYGFGKVVHPAVPSR